MSDKKINKAYLAPGERFVKANEFYTRLAVSKTKFYMAVREGSLPAPIKVSPRNSVWPLSVVNKTIESIKDGTLKF